MYKRRVTVLYTHTLVGRGIAQLLQADQQLEVTCLRADQTDVTEQLNRLQPHVIVIAGSEESPYLRCIVKDLPPALFIGVHLDDNLMDIYRSRQVMPARPETLLDAIHHGLRRRQPQQVRPTST